MINAKGYATFSSTTPLVLYSFERRDLKDHDVVIDIKFCGVCHSDICMTRDKWKFDSLYPVVTGEEIAGFIRPLDRG